MQTQTPTLKPQPLFLLGFGSVGRALAKQIVAARDLHAERCRLRLDVVAIADSTSVVTDKNGVCDPALIQLVQQKVKTGRLTEDQRPFDRLRAGSTQDLEQRDDLSSFIFHLSSNTIIVDTTATDATVPLLLGAKRRGMGVVLANKLPIAGEMAWWDAIADERSRWETTCGAALPVISTLNTLLDSGDEVQRIEGSLSGTLGFIASQLEAGVKFGDAVRDAKGRGYTEPDPRQDLGGLDAARKALILARMLSYRLEMKDVQVESLYPNEMDELSVDEFLREVDGLNDGMAKRASELTQGGRKLRYAATVENGQCKVGLVGADPTTKLGGIRTSDSIVVFTTKYFSDNPVSVSGRGAGQAVTASGVLGDIISLSRVI